MTQIAANGLTFDVEDVGEQGAPVVLLIMGLGMPAAAWPENLVELLVRAGLRVIRFDNRDSGHSTKLRTTHQPNLQFAIARALMRLPVHAPYTLDDMAADAAGLLTALGVERAHVVGASLGGMIAQVLAAKFPQRVLSLTSIMSSTGNPSPRVAFGSQRALRAILLRPSKIDDVTRADEPSDPGVQRHWQSGLSTGPGAAAGASGACCSARLLPGGLDAAAARRPCLGRPPCAAGPHRGADTRDPWPR